MPQVGNKHFPYSEKGQAQAKAEAKKTGKPVKNKKKGPRRYDTATNTYVSK